MSGTLSTHDGRTSRGAGTLSVRRTIEQGRVRQNFSHGRSKQVVVERKRKRFVAKPGKNGKPAIERAETAVSVARAAATASTAKAAASPRPSTKSPRRRPAPSSSNGGYSGRLLRDLTDGERDARARALSEARQYAFEEQKRAEEKNRQRGEYERAERLAKEKAAAETEHLETVKTTGKTPSARGNEVEAAPSAPEATAEQGTAEPTPAPNRSKLAAPPELAGKREEKPSTRRGASRREDKPSVRAKGHVERRRGRLTITNALEGDEARERSLASLRRRQERQKRQGARIDQPREKISREVVLPEAIMIQDLANRMAERAVDVIKLLMKQGQMLKINDVIDADTAELVAGEMGHRVKRVREADVEIGLMGEDDRPEELRPRTPVITVMGHVDHGKTSLLDAIRKADIVTGEAGGITQHIGAYQVEASAGAITFIDTPGHEAFASMRARGAKITDIVVLVVAADDGVMPQTIEAIGHARAAQAPIVVAINKIDKPDADPQHVRRELLQHGMVLESMGGEVLEVEISAIKRINLDRLLDAIVLQAEMLELKANPDRPADGAVIEAELDKGRGCVATVLVQRGTLRIGDIVVAGSSWGRVRALTNDRGVNVDHAGPSVPVEILGLNAAPRAGDSFVIVANEQRAREITAYRERKRREIKGTTAAHISLEQMMNQLRDGTRKELPVLVKADVQGSAEAIVQTLEKLGNEEIRARAIFHGVGGVSESDVTLAAASNALILAFNVRANRQAREAAERVGVEIRYYTVIYGLADDIRAAMEGMLSPAVRERFLGNAEIAEIFSVSKIGKVAGCRVSEGVVRARENVRLIRDDVVIHEGALSSLKRFKDEVREVAAGQDCGMAFANYQDMRQGDVVECYKLEKVARKL